MSKYLYIPILPELKEKFTLDIKKRKGVRGGAIIESTTEAIKLWLEHPELVGGN